MCHPVIERCEVRDVDAAFGRDREARARAAARVREHDIEPPVLRGRALDGARERIRRCVISMRERLDIATHALQPRTARPRALRR